MKVAQVASLVHSKLLIRILQLNVIEDVTVFDLFFDIVDWLDRNDLCVRCVRHPVQLVYNRPLLVAEFEAELGEHSKEVLDSDQTPILSVCISPELPNKFVPICGVLTPDPFVDIPIQFDNFCLVLLQM